MPPVRLPTLGLLLAAGLGAAGPAASGPGVASPFLEQVRGHFAAWDADHDGVLSGNEIERALADPANAGPAGAAAATLRRSFYASSKFRPLSLAMITAAVGHDPGLSGDGKPKPPAYETMFAADLKKVQHTDKDLFAAGLPHVETLGQGRLGDCFLLAPLGSVAGCQPERLKAMVSEQPGGRVAVHFGGGRTVTCPAPTDGEIAIGSDAYSSANDGVWGNLFEKAIGQVMLERQEKYVTPYQMIGGGSTPNVPLSIMTGHTCKRVGCEDFQRPGKLDRPARTARLDAMRDELTAAFKAGRLVCGGTAEIHAGEVVVPGLFYDHSYGVLGYDRRADVVTFWNPHGNAYSPKGPPGLEHGYPTSHGRFDCPLVEAVMWFGSFSIETDQPATK